MEYYVFWQRRKKKKVLEGLGAGDWVENQWWWGRVREAKGTQHKGRNLKEYRNKQGKRSEGGVLIVL